MAEKMVTLFITIKALFMKGQFNPANLWFTRTFDEEKKPPKRKMYQSYCEGYVAYHDIHVDKIDWNDPSKRHRLEFDWRNRDKTIDVYLYPFDGKTGTVKETMTSSQLYSLTSSLPGSVTVHAARVPLSDPPVPPPPPPPSGF